LRYNLNMIVPGKNRKCIFTGLPANRSLEISKFKDKHNPTKSVPASKEYLQIRKDNMSADLLDREEEIFVEYWRLEALLSIKNSKDVDFSKLIELQNKNKELSKKEIDFDKLLESRIDKLSNNQDLVAMDEYAVLVKNTSVKKTEPL